MDGVGSRGQRDLGGSCSHAPTGPRAAAPRRRRVGPSGRPPQPQRLRRPHAHLQSHLRGPLCPSKRTRTDVHLSGLAGPSWDMTAAIPNRAEAPRAPPSTCTVPQSHPQTWHSLGHLLLRQRQGPERRHCSLPGRPALCRRGGSAAVKLPLHERLCLCV